MKKAGIREARQNLSVLIDEVKKGHEVVITERGKPVAVIFPRRGVKSGLVELACRNAASAAA